MIPYSFECDYTEGNVQDESINGAVGPVGEINTESRAPQQLSSSPPAQPQVTYSTCYELDPQHIYLHDLPYYQCSLPKMSLAYENRGFADYPAGTIMDEPSHEHAISQHHQSYPSPNGQAITNYTSEQLASALRMEEVSSPGRSKPLVKPERDVTKSEDGRFICTWNGCTEEIRAFNRKCEWSKHMDKHDRPYKCPEEGCDKLPGFTYSGGLLRHQREVHNLHGGPRKQLNCPHVNCKRHGGKGFSRQENLNEHLRRVHTSSPSPANEDTEDEGERTRIKRKRVDQEGNKQVDYSEAYGRLAQENQELRRQVEMQGAQIADLIQRLQEVQHNMLQNQAPQALM